MRLNVGCGQFPEPGWVNTDRDPDVRPDVVWDILDLIPNRLYDLDRVYLGHVLEHVPVGRVVEVLTNIRTVMVDGAAICIVGPDYVRGHQGGFDTETLDGIVAGPSDDDPHLWVCTEATIIVALQAAGFSQVTPWRIERLPPIWPVVSRVGWQCAVTATA